MSIEISANAEPAETFIVDGRPNTISEIAANPQAILYLIDRLRNAELAVAEAIEIEADRDRLRDAVNGAHAICEVARRENAVLTEQLRNTEEALTVAQVRIERRVYHERGTARLTLDRLKTLEWAAYNTVTAERQCRACGGSEPEHEYPCWLAAAIKEAERE